MKFLLSGAGRILVCSICLVFGFVVFFILPFRSNAETTAYGGTKKSEPILEWATWNGEGEAPRAYSVVQLGEFERNSYGSTGYAHGYFTNRRSNSLMYVQILIGLYVDDVKVGSCFANQNNIAGGGSWRFEALCTSVPSSAFTYRVDDVTSW